MRAEDCKTMEEARAWCLNAEYDREKKRRETRQGAFDAAMLSLDAHMASFEDASKIATFSDEGVGAAMVRSFELCGDSRSVCVDPRVKKRMLNKLRKYPYLQKALRRFIGNATSKKRRPVKKTHVKKICEILFGQVKTGSERRQERMRECFRRKSETKTLP